MEPIFDTYEEMQARTLLESVPPKFWEPSDEAKSQVRKEFLDQITKPPQNVQQFHRSFGQAVREKALQIARQVDDWHKEGRLQWKVGDHAYSAHTGKTYRITGYGSGGPLKNPYPVYRYQHGEEGSDHYEAGTFNADKVHAEGSTLKLITPKS